MKSVYIHVPFCKQKCLYCDFNSFANKENLIDEYFNSVQKEILKANIKDELYTIYIGGGTPSFVDSKYIASLLRILPKAVEITLEANPCTVTMEKLIEYKKMGVTRLSLGLQTADDSILKAIGRLHTKAQFEKAYILAREVGFNNINIDLMFALPNQTIDNFKESVSYVLSLNPEHISAYSLILHKDIFKNLPNDDEERAMYHYLVDTLVKHGYEHYEISNFAKHGFESKHNLAYWDAKEYFGFGAGASGYIDSKRYINIKNLEEYISKINNGEDVSIIEEVLNVEDKINESMLLGLRKIAGVCIQEINDKYNIDVLEKYKEALNKLLKYELIEIDNNIKLTKKGLDLANIVWEEFV